MTESFDPKLLMSRARNEAERRVLSGADSAGRRWLVNHLRSRGDGPGPVPTPPQPEIGQPRASGATELASGGLFETPKPPTDSPDSLENVSPPPKMVGPTRFDPAADPELMVVDGSVECTVIHQAKNAVSDDANPTGAIKNEGTHTVAAPAVHREPGED